MLLRSCVYLRHTIYPCAALLAFMALLLTTESLALYPAENSSAQPGLTEPGPFQGE